MLFTNFNKFLNNNQEKANLNKHQQKRFLYITFMFCVFLITQNNISYAQSTKNQIELSYGVFSYDNYSDLVGQMFNGMFTFQSYTINSKTGAVFLNYSYKPGKYFSYGISTGIDHVNGDIVKSNDSSKPYTIKTYTTALETKFTFLDKHSLAMHTALGIGYTLREINTEYEITRDGTENHFNFHYDAFCISYGNKFKIATAIGFGYKGIVRGGISYNF